jgi:hypothetical protein
VDFFVTDIGDKFVRFLGYFVADKEALKVLEYLSMG